MTRRSDKQVERSFMVADKPQGQVWAVGSYCDYDCSSDGFPVVALFDSEQIARQFAEARDYPVVRKMDIYHAMKAHW